MTDIAHMQTFEKGGAKLSVLTKGVQILENSDFEAKIRGVNSLVKNYMNLKQLAQLGGCVCTAHTLHMGLVMERRYSAIIRVNKF